MTVCAIYPNLHLQAGILKKPSKEIVTRDLKPTYDVNECYWFGLSDQKIYEKNFMDRRPGTF